MSLTREVMSWDCFCSKCIAISFHFLDIIGSRKLIFPLGVEILHNSIVASAAPHHCSYSVTTSLMLKRKNRLTGINIWFQCNWNPGMTPKSHRFISSHEGVCYRGTDAIILSVLFCCFFHVCETAMQIFNGLKNFKVF